MIVKTSCIIIFLLLLLFYIFEKNRNNERHLTASYPYAHFSELNNLNYILYPSLLFTRPTYITLKAGESLFIPKKWWHWIRSDPGTRAINFTFNKNNTLGMKPEKIVNLINVTDKHLIEDIIQRSINVKYNYWNNSSDPSLKYIITVEGYKDLEKNMLIKENFQDISLLSEIKTKYACPKSEFDFNLWISISDKDTNSYHDTGLHYDSLDSILYVFTGEKTITLYPPEDSYLLAPFDITPNYARQKPIFMYYNAYHIKGDIKGLPSGHLLYKTLEFCANSSKVLIAVQKLYDNKQNKEIVWGFKKTGEVYRWELYYYHYSVSDINRIEKYNFNKLYSRTLTDPVLNILNAPDTVIHSVDIENQDITDNDEIHTYEITGTRSFPFYGKGFDIINQYKKQVGIFVYDRSSEVKKNYVRYLTELGLPHTLSVLKILMTYPSEYMCIWNKNGDLFIQWMNISIESFISFLEKLSYKEELITYIKDHIEEYRNLSHEITIVYDPVSLIAKRSGFYGCI